MKVAYIKFANWDKPYIYNCAKYDLEIGEKVVVKTGIATELGEVVQITEIKDKQLNKIKEYQGRQTAEQKDGDTLQNQEGDNDNSEVKEIIRKANLHDVGNIPSFKEKKAALDFCKKTKERLNLPMKFIDVHFSFDRSRITFAFIADGRVDFRILVKELTRHFGRTIRLQQIGIRDEAKIMGDIGHCGKELCCRGHLRELASITSEMAELQQCSHRGSDRISGVCGRLMCCLAYEQEGYEALAKQLPDIGRKVSVDGKRGVIVGHHTLKQSVDVEFTGNNGSEKTVMEVDLNRNKK